MWAPPFSNEMVSSAKNAQTPNDARPVRRRACFTGPMTEPELLEASEARAANPHLRGIGSSSCPYGECDGNGLVLEDSGDARACRCRAERIARNRTRGLHDTIPERYRDVAFDRAPVNEMEPHTVRHVRRFCERIESQPGRRQGVPLLRRPRHRQDHARDADRPARAQGTPDGRDLHRRPGCSRRSARPTSRAPSTATSG